MTSPNAVRCFGTSKTYGRARENVASRSFDEMMKGDSAPMKASPAHTKWGMTNYVAVRDGKTTKQGPKGIAVSEDPFSFDTDDKGKFSPVKPQHRPWEVEAERASTRLPASRIVTQGARSGAGAASGSASSQESQSPVAIARPGRTYTHSHDGRLNTGRSTQLVLDRFVEVGSSLNRFGNGSVYSSDHRRPCVTERSPTRYGIASFSSSLGKSPKKPVMVPSSSSQYDYDGDIFQRSYGKSPLKPYSGDVITPISSYTSDGSPAVKRRLEHDGLPYQYKQKDYSEPAVSHDIYSRYGESPRTDLTTSSGTVIPKSKFEMHVKKTDDGLSAYCKAFTTSPDDTRVRLQMTSHVPVLHKIDTSDSSVDAKSSPATLSSGISRSSSSSQGTNSSISSSSRTRVSDKQTVSSASDTYSKYVLSRKFQPAVRGKDKSVKQSGQEPAKSVFSVRNSNSSSSSSSSLRGGSSASQRSGAKQYRIFKSRRVPQAVPEEPVKEEENKEDEEPPFVCSPSMPELTLEVEPHELLSSAGSEYDRQNPPNITGLEGMEASTEPSQVSQKDDVTESDSQVSQTSCEDVFERRDKPVADSSSPQTRPSDSQDTLSVGTDDSQELSQEVITVSSSTESSQKQEDVTDSCQKQEEVPAQPRRFFKSKKSFSASSLHHKMLKKSPSKALYNARSWHQDETAVDKFQDEGEDSPPVKRAKIAMPFSDDEDFSLESPKVPKMVRSVHWPSHREQEAYTSVRVNAHHKQLYTVVHNVKMAHEVQESGETQDFIDDIEYLLDNLEDNRSISIRSLSTVQLAGKCILPAFRMHLRAHGIVAKIFSLLHDACSYPSLALSTAAMMFMLSRDRLNMDLDRESLHLMLKLNEVDMPRGHDDNMHEGDKEGVNAEDRGELEKCRRRIQDLLAQLQKESNAKQIDLDFVSTGNLAMESLLSLTSRRAGEWFKEELRTLGGLDHFVQTIHHCVTGMREDLACNLYRYTPSLKKLDRCLRVLENITFMNSDNQTYLIAYNKGLLITSTGRLLHHCVDCLLAIPLQEVLNGMAVKDQDGWIVFECLLAVLRVLLNITHDSQFGSTRVGEEAGLLQIVLQCVASTQWCVPADHRFDLLVLSLGLLVNLMEHSPMNRRYLLESTLTGQISEYNDPTEMRAVQALVQLFLQHERAARQIEEAPETPVKGNDSLNRSGEWHESDSGIEWLTRSAEKAKSAEEGKEQEGEGEANKSTDGASILEDDDTFTKALHKAGKHMENNIVAAYVGLLLGCLIQDNRKYANVVSQYLPKGSFDSMIQILKKFLGFMNLTTAIGTTDANSIQRVIDTLEAC